MIRRIYLRSFTRKMGKMSLWRTWRLWRKKYIWDHHVRRLKVRFPETTFTDKFIAVLRSMLRPLEPEKIVSNVCSVLSLPLLCLFQPFLLPHFLLLLLPLPHLIISHQFVSFWLSKNLVSILQKNTPRIEKQEWRDYNEKSISQFDRLSVSHQWAFEKILVKPEHYMVIL